MSFLNTLMESRAEVVQLSLRDPALHDIFSGGRTTIAGVNISERTALRISAVYSCVNSISQTVATMPFITYERTSNGKERAENHPVFKVLKTQPNPFMTPATFIQTLQAHLLLWGNSFAEIERDGGGRVVALWPWHPSRVRLTFRGDSLFYIHSEAEGGDRVLPAANVLHLRGLGDDGMLGYSVISLHRETLGLCQASQDYRARFFVNDARPNGVLEHPGVLGEQARNNLRESFSRQVEGRAFAILEENMHWKDVGIPPDDAQFIEGWEASKEDIAGIYRVPPYKIGILKPGTVSFASVEQANQDYWTDCILWWATCWEQTCDIKLFTEREQRTYFTEMLADNLLRADSRTRAETLQIWRRNGIINANEWRTLENLNKLTDDIGDKYVIEGNMTTLEKVGEEPVVGAGGVQPAKTPQQLNGAAH